MTTHPAPILWNQPLGQAGAPPAPGPLAPEHLRELADARVRAKGVRRAATVAVLGGWTTGAGAAITILGGLFSATALVLGLGLGFVAFHEFRGSAHLRRFDPAAPRRLALNQFFLSFLIVAYAFWSAWSALHAPSMTSQVTTGDPRVDEMLRDMERPLTLAVYSVVAVIGLIVPVLAAWYYSSRTRIVEAFIAKTPPWVVEAMRAGVA